MKRTLIVALISMVAILVVNHPGLAHHSSAMFDQNNTITVVGVVKHWELTNTDHALDSRLPVGRKTPDIRTADAYRGCAESQRLINIRAAPDAAVDENRNASSHGLSNFGNAFNGSPSGFCGTAAMI